MPPHTRQRLAFILLWVTPALWSSNYLIARASHEVIAPHLLALGRWSLALLLMLPFTWRGLVSGFAHWRHEWKQLLVLGGLGMWICGAFVYIGGHTTSATNIGLIYAATPIGISIASTWLLHERMTWLQRLAVLPALAGVLFVIAKGELANLLGVRFTVGDGWIVVAAVSWIAYSILLQRWKSALGTMERIAAVTLGGLVVLLPFTLIEALVTPPLPFTAKAGWLIVAAAVMPGFFSYQAYGFMLRELGASRAGMVTYLAPVYAAFTAWLVLGEPPRAYHAAGALLILPSIYLATRPRA
jgi:drug/metabolite transporter (DMT)-like permease